MNKSRLEAFSDGVIAIIITIMVLEFRIPHDTHWDSLKPLVPVFVSYVISFLSIGNYWGNHHHLFQAARKVNSSIMLSNLALLFWLSLLPFATAWMGENQFKVNTIIFYSLIHIFCSVAYGFLQTNILKTLDSGSEIVKAIRSQNKKVIISLFAIVAAIPLALVQPYLAAASYLFQLMIWFIPDKKIEKALYAEVQPEK